MEKTKLVVWWFDVTKNILTYLCLAHQIQQLIPKLRIRISNFSTNKNCFIILACLFVYLHTLFIISNRENLRFVVSLKDPMNKIKPLLKISLLLASSSPLKYCREIQPNLLRIESNSFNIARFLR